MKLAEGAHIAWDAPQPGSTKWKSMITPSKIPAMLGISWWQSPADLFTEMLTALDQVADCGYEAQASLRTAQEKLLRDRPAHFAWGHIAEASLADWWHMRRGGHLTDGEGWHLSHLRRTDEGTHNGELTIFNADLPYPNLCSLDRMANRRVEAGEESHILECKTDPDMSSAMWQVAAQMLITGIPTASIISLHAGATPVITDLWQNPDITAWLNERCTAWNMHLIDRTTPNFEDFLAPTITPCHLTDPNLAPENPNHNPQEH